MSEATHKTVTLDNPITRGKEVISEIQLRKPKTGELRGLNVVDILNMDVNAVSNLLPRITSPLLTKEEVQELAAEDFVQLAGEVTSFLIPKKMR
ncbi:MAG: phage tail assembly protein [Shewanella xiamenensis]|jgi:hypothetical protein|uniref:phage tail assembly protein n=1 Tax=Shewanella sp. TaxID=50422 RepID=UPI00242DE50F|nr:phage tail assembly protein [Shewanella xiamenensis]